MAHHKSHSAVGPILYGRGVCEGYAMAYKLLCDAAKIHCIVVFGDAKANDVLEEGGHAWNIVKLQGKCYHADCTWDSALFKKGVLSHVYFNVTDKDISVDHYWKKDELPECFNTEHNYFYKEGSVFESAASAKKYIAKCLSAGRKSVEVKVEKDIISSHDASVFVGDAIVESGQRIYDFLYAHRVKQGVMTVFRKGK